jgi:hypothetical protein
VRYLGLLSLFALTPAAFGQVGNPAAQQNFLPNFYNRSTQPLSPYLNLVRNGNPALNYYYGARPGLPSGGVNNFGVAPPIQQPVGPLAGGFLPQSQVAFDPSSQTYEPGGQPIRLNSPAHSVLFGNAYPQHGSYFNVYAQNVNRGGFNSGQQRPTQSVTGLGNVNRTPTQRSSTAGGTSVGGRRPPTITAVP